MGRRVNNHNKGEWTSQYRKHNFPKYNTYEKPSPELEVLRGDVPHTNCAKSLLTLITFVSTIRTVNTISSIPKMPNNSYTSVENQSSLSNTVKNATGIRPGVTQRVTRSHFGSA